MIRPATLEDLPNMEDAARAFYASSSVLKGFDKERFIAVWTELIQRDIGVIFVTVEAGRVRGALGGMVYPDAYSERLVATEMFWFIEPGFRGCGMRLYREFEAWARARGCREIRMVHLADSMPEKLDRVYHRLGYEPCEVHYRKELAQ